MTLHLILGMVVFGTDPGGVTPGVEEILSAVDRAYALAGPITFTLAECAAGELGGPIPWAQANAMLETGNLPPPKHMGHQRVVEYHPVLGIRMEEGHPSVMPVQGPNQVKFIGAGGLTSVSRGAREGVRSGLPPDVDGALIGRLVPPRLPEFVRWRLGPVERVGVEDVGGVLRLRSGVDGSSVDIDPRDWTVLGWTDRSHASSESEERVLEWHARSPFRARFAKTTLVVLRLLKRDGVPTQVTYVTYGEPRALSSVEPERFEWWRLVSVAVDMRTGARFGPGDVLLASDTRVDTAESSVPSRNADAPMHIETPVRPGDPVLPRRRDRWRHGLLAAGVGCLVLAAAWWLRRAWR